MGALLIDAGKITAQDAERILRYSRERGVRFGDAAIALKLVGAEEIQQALARQFDYPYLSRGESGVSEEVIAAWAPFKKQVEALRALRSQLLLRWFSDDQKSIAVLSPGRKDGRTYLAANLAVVFSQLGERTLLVDGDLREPRQHELFGLDNATGLSTVLAGRATSEVVQRVPGFMDLSVLTSGAVPPNPLELLAREGFDRAMQEYARQFDVIIIDTPSAVRGSDGEIIASKSHGALMLARANLTRIDDCVALGRSVKEGGGTLVGTVFNDY